MYRLLVLFLALSACSEKKSAEPGRETATATPPSRDDWWKQATSMPSGAERILAPREMRRLLAIGESYGFDSDSNWWSERSNYVWDRILSMDPDDEQANAGKGYRTLQSLPGFTKVWERMLTARVTTKDIDGLIADYDHKVAEEEPVFLNPEGYAVEQARLARARKHLDRLEQDPGYEALQVAIARVRGTSLNDYPFVHHAAGPFLIFYCARDLQRIEGEDDAAEDRRIADRRAQYKARLEKLGAMYVALVDDIRKLYPALWKRHGGNPRDIHYQWIFGERSWYQDYLERIRKSNPEATYRTGFLDKATGWAYVYEPAETKAEEGQPAPPSVEAVVKETAAYLAASQLMHRWGKDRQGVGNHLERSRAYWLKEGWPAFMAARRVERPLIGRALVEAKRFRMLLPPLSRVIDRESRLELLRYNEPAHEFDEDEEEVRPELRVQRAFSDLAWLVVRYFHDDSRRGAFTRYLRAQIEGDRKLTFEECFGVKSEAEWRKFTRDAYRSIGNE